MTSLTKAQIKSQLVMLRHYVDEADQESAELLYRELFREIDRLTARFPIGANFKVPISLPRETVVKFAAGRKS